MNVRVEFARAGWFFIQYLVQQHPGVAPKWQLAGEHLKQDNSQRINIAPPVSRMSLAARLLGRHVGRRTEHLTVHRHGHLTYFTAGQTKIHQMRLAFGVHHHVGRFQIAMDDALLVCVMQSLGNFCT